MSANPVLVTTTRSDLVEIKHRGSFCVVRANGQPLIEQGNCSALTYPRSALKLVQALPLLESEAADSYCITDEEVALICASHNSEPQHVATARSILSKAGLDETYLQCGKHTPMCEATFAQCMRDQTEISAIHNNCSGKHAGFLALANHLRSDLDGYLALDHPVQVRIREAVCDVYEVAESALHVGVDGCTAPNYAMPLKQMALGFARLCDRETTWTPRRRVAINRVQRAMCDYPFMVAGTGRFCTEMLETMKGAVIGKLGAAGVYCLGLPGQGIGAAVKIDDGTTGPPYAVAMAILKALDVESVVSIEALEKFARAEVLNCHGGVVGYRQLERGIETAIGGLICEWSR